MSGTRLLLSAAAAAALVALGVSSVAAQSRLIGDTYTFSGGNFPNDFGITLDPETQEEQDWGSPPVELTFDGVEEQAGGMLVNERTFDWEGREGGIHGVNFIRVQQGDEDGEIDILDWESPGEIVEFSFRTEDGGWISDFDAFHGFYAARGLDWANSAEESLPTFFNNTFYLWYGQDGVPLSNMNVLFDTGIYVTEHPFDETIPEVAMITYSDGQVEDITNAYSGGMDLFGGTTQLTADATWSLLAEAVGLEPYGETNGRDANEFHIGFLVTPPESVGCSFDWPGDANCDGTTDLADFNILKGNFNTAGGLADGDFNDDGQVDLADFNILKANFNTSQPVPEPAAAVLALVAAGGVVAFRRRR